MPVATMDLFHGQLTIGETGAEQTFGSQATNVRLVPSVDQEDNVWVLDGGSAGGSRSESWTLEGSIIQDFGTTTNTVSLSEWTFTNRGKEMPFIFLPNDTSAKEVSGILTVEATQIGGDVNTRNQADFNFRLVGEPVLAAVGV